MGDRSRIGGSRGPIRAGRARGPAAALVGIGLALAACGGGSDDPGDSAAARSAPGAPPAAAARIPVAEPTGPPDAARADRGQEVFSARGCVACHYVGRNQRLVGPDLGGVHERRSFVWFYSMVMNPDSMIRNDSTAKALFLEYMTPMVYQGVQPEEVPALWDYLRRASEGERAP